MIEVLTKENFKTEIFDFTANKEWVFEKQTPIILNFFAPWCGPCHMFAPTLQEVSEQYATLIKVFKIDIDQDPELARLFEIQSVPTTLFLNPNEEPVLASGLLSKESVERGIREIFGIE